MAGQPARPQFIPARPAEGPGIFDRKTVVHLFRATGFRLWTIAAVPGQLSHTSGQLPHVTGQPPRTSGQPFWIKIAVRPFWDSRPSASDSLPATKGNCPGTPANCPTILATVRRLRATVYFPESPDLQPITPLPLPEPVREHSGRAGYRCATGAIPCLWAWFCRKRPPLHPA